MRATSIVRVATVPFLALGAVAVQAGTLRVPTDFTTVQSAIDAAATGDTVLVAPGSYTHSEVRTIYWVGTPYSFRSCALLKEGVAVVSEGGPAATTLDMAGLGTDTPAAVVGAFNQGTGPMLLQGFTLKGVALGGQGVYAHDSGVLTVRDCVMEDFDGRSRGAGGGLGAFRSPVEVYDCVFRRCLGSSGGGVKAHEADIVVDGCVFEECDTGLMAWAITGSNSVTVRNSRFERNTTAGIRKGSQMHFALIEDCWFEGNVLGDELQAVSITSGPVTLRRCVFLNNSAADDCAALKWQAANGTIIGNTFVGNAILGGGSNGAAIEMLNGGNITFAQNIVAGNAGAPAIRVTGATNVTDSCNLFWDNADGDVLGLTLDSTTVFADPEFCDPDNGDLAVANGSPCVTTAGCDQIGALGAGRATVSVESETWARIKSRFLR